MIVETDFLDHWKTRLLVRLLNTETAPLHVIRLWAHCQQRKSDKFDGWNKDVLASVCRWPGDAGVFWDAMLQTFVEMEGGRLVVHGWAQTNASLISAWNNGTLGGRPKKPMGNPPVNPPVTDGLPVGNPPVNPNPIPVNPPVTHGVTDREEKSRLEGEDRKDVKGESIGVVPPPAKQPRPKFVPPTREELDLQAAKIGLPADEVDEFVNYYAGVGWKVGRNSMVSWPHTLARWASRWRKYNAGRNSSSHGPNGNPRNHGIAGLDEWERERQARAVGDGQDGPPA